MRLLQKNPDSGPNALTTRDTPTAPTPDSEPRTPGRRPRPRSQESRTNTKVLWTGAGIRGMVCGVGVTKA